MPIPIAIALAVLLMLAIACAVFWSVAVWRILRTRRDLPTPRDGQRLPPPDVSVCIVVPAHDEADVIGTLLASLRRQDHARVRIVVALDRCTDDSERIARDHARQDPRIEVLRIDQCPEGWAGKVNAIWQAVQRSEHAADADLLLFTDADTEFDPACVRATAALLEQRRLDMLSLVSTLGAEQWFERAVQPAAGLELLRQYPLTRASDPDPSRRRAFANGQFMLFRAGAYRAIGGHEAVRDALLEDIAFARMLRDRAMPAAVLLADGMLVCRMYRGWDAFRRGWKRIYTEAANRRPARLRRAALQTRLSGTVLPAGAFVCTGAAGVLLARHPGDPLAIGALVVGAAGLGAFAAAMVMVLRIAYLPAWAGALYPFGAWATGSILREAARDLDAGTPTRWGGREYVREKR